MKLHKRLSCIELWMVRLVLSCFFLSFTNVFATVTVPGDYSTIQSVLDDLKAGSLPDGEVIEVSPGVYQEAITYAEGTRSFTLRSIAGAESTIIDATGTNRSAIYFRDTDAIIRIEGFTVTGGENSGGGGGLNFHNASAIVSDLIVEENSAYSGGGMHLYGSSTSIENSIFRNNIATKAGGAISIVEGSIVTIVDSEMVDNIIGSGEPIAHGGGIHLGHSTLTIIGSVISGNIAKFAGGGIFAIGTFGSPFGITTLTIEDSVVSNNQVIHDAGNALGVGGGIHVEDNTIAYVLNSTIVDNFSTGNGGGLNTAKGHLEVRGSLIENNNGPGGTGGGIHGVSKAPYAGSAFVVDSVIRNNSALLSGGISMGGNGCGSGGVCADLVIERVLIDGNIADNFGGGINLDGTVMSVIDSQVLRNGVVDSGGGTGGGLRITNSTVDIYNTSISGNFAAVTGGGFYVANASDISVDMSKIYANAVAQADKGGGLHIGSSGPPDGLIQNTVIADNSGFQIREQSCLPELPSPILSYLYNNINDPLSGLYKSPCGPPGEINDIEEFNALSPAAKTISNYDTIPDFLVYSATPLPRGGSALAWTRPGSNTVEIQNLGSFAGPVGSVDVYPACTSTYSLDSASVTIDGTDAIELEIIDQNIRSNKIIEATDNISVQDSKVAAGVDVTFKAKNSILISNQFVVELGGSLHLQIDPILCSETL